MSRFDWDPVKAEANFRKHGVTSEEADQVTSSPLSIVEHDVDHCRVEARAKIMGWSPMGRLIVVIVSLGGPRPRIISARRATKRERDEYVG